MGRLLDRVKQLPTTGSALSKVMTLFQNGETITKAKDNGAEGNP